MTEIATSIRYESRDRYLTYALSVITSRALPDVRDGLKPVQRRILYAMFRNLNLKPESNHRKSAAVVGEVLARFHPHGDVACYEAMVRMAQDFSLRYPLVNGQGNFGSLDGDSAAAYRYTEAKLLPIALDVVGEIGQETVDFRDNFDATTTEPVVLPSRVPHLLMNGASGIAVGMATNIPPHNINDVVKALLILLDDPEATNGKLATAIKGPDFPTGCSILNSKYELTDIYKTGRGSLKMRADWKLEDLGRGKQAVIVYSLPYTVNKSQIVEKIADLIIQKKVPQLNDVRDESTEDIRVVIELTSGADPEVAMAYLFKHTQLENTFAVNLTALTPSGADGAVRPELLSLKHVLSYFLEFRREVVIKRLQFEKKNLLARIHILEGLVKIYDKLDEAIKIIRSSSGRSDAAQKLRKRFKLSEIQSFAIVDMRLYQLSKTSIAEIRAELTEKQKRVKQIDALLKSKKKISGLIKDDLEEVVNLYGDKRKSKIVKDSVDIELNESDYVVQEDVFAIVTKDGWLKKIRQNNSLETTRIREGDVIHRAHAVSTIDKVALITSHGYLYTLPVADFPSSSGYGTPIQKLLKFRDGEQVVDSFAVKGEDSQLKITADIQALADNDTLVFISKRGMGYGYTIEGLGTEKRNGKRVMKLRAGDSLCAVTPLNSNIVMVTKKASGLLITKKEVPVRNNPAVGVILMSVRDDDELRGAVSFKGAKKIELQLSTGKEKKISTSDITKGRRGLKGTKVVGRGEINGIELA